MFLIHVGNESEHVTASPLVPLTTRQLPIMSVEPVAMLIILLFDCDETVPHANHLPTVRALLVQHG